jgi:UDP-N-acetylglucosamine--N-acetylmuramyl-(pentapeptide) pyrophosphoryl-undecaprenol N-acetylglucosamine transferase
MSPRLVLAGGGTGGHVFPMIAVADAIRRLAPEVDLVFVGTARGMEAQVVPARGYALELVDVLPMRGGGVRGLMRGAVRAARSIPEARALLGRLGPAAVFSAGGYAAGPVTIAARTLGVPVGLMEPNSAIGLSNRLAAPFVQRAYTAFDESARHFSPSVVRKTGVPIRGGFRPAPYPERAANGLHVLVVGGSQGARSLNEAVPRALARLGVPKIVTHQAGSHAEEAVRAEYERLGAARWATVVPFIEDMPGALAGADLVISRAGASAVAEICAVGRPSLLIPYPFAGDHQRFNALSLESAGAAVCLFSADATEERIATEVGRLLAEASTLPRMAECARTLGRPDAADAIAEDLLRLAGLDRGTPLPMQRVAGEDSPARPAGGAGTAPAGGIR